MDLSGGPTSMDTMKSTDGGHTTTVNDLMEPILSYSSSAGELLDTNNLNNENQQHPTFNNSQAQSTVVPASSRPPVVETTDRGVAVLKNQEETSINNIPRPNGGDGIALSRDVSLASSSTSTVPTVATTVVSDSTIGTNRLDVGAAFIPKSINDFCYTEIVALKEGNGNVFASTTGIAKMSTVDPVQLRDPQQLAQLQQNAASQQPNQGHSTNNQYQQIVVPTIQSDRSIVAQDSPRPPLSRNPSNEQQLQASCPPNSSIVPSRSILKENTSTPIQPPPSPLMTPQFVPIQQHRSTSPAVPPPIPLPVASHLTPSTYRHSNGNHNHHLQQVIDVSVPLAQPSNTSEPPKRKSRFVVLAQNPVPAKDSQIVEESQKQLPEYHKQDQNQSNDACRHHNGLDMQPLTSSHQQTREHHNGSRFHYVATPSDQKQSSAAFPERTQQPQMQYPAAPQYIIVTGAPPGNPPVVDPAPSSRQYHIIGTQSAEQPFIIPNQAFGGHATGSAERHNRAMSEGVAENITQVMYLQPVTNRHYRPRSEGIPDTSSMQHDQRQTIAQGIEFYQYGNSDQPNGSARGTSRHQNQVDTSNVNQSNRSQMVSGDTSPSFSINTGPASQSNTGQNQQSATNLTSQCQSSFLALPPLNVQGRQPSASTNATNAEASGPSLGVRNGNSESGTIKMTKGRFRVLDSGTVPPTQNNGSFEGPAEVSDSTSSGANLLPGGVQASAANSTIKKGRFVVLNVTEATPAYQPGQSSHIPGVVAMPHLTNNETASAVSSYIDQSANTIVSSTNDSPNNSTSEAQKIDTNISNQSHTRDTTSSDSPSNDETHQLGKSTQEKDASLVKAKSASGEATSNRFSASPVQKERNNTPSMSVGAVGARSTKTPNVGQQAGVGKLMYHLNMMQSEMNELDRFHRNLQTENKCLKEKNKELESRARDWEKKFYTEKSLREKAEAKVKDLKAKIKSSKVSVSTLDAEAGKIEEANSMSTSIVRGKISRTNSTDGDAELSDLISRSDGTKIDGTINLKINENGQLSHKQRSDCSRETDVVASPQVSKETKNLVSSDCNQISPTRDQSGRTGPIPKHPILPMLQRKAVTRGPVSSSSMQNISKKIAESRQQSAPSSTTTGPQNGETNDTPSVSNQNSPVSKASQSSILNGLASMDAHKSFDKHTAVVPSSIPPKPQGVRVKSRSDNGGTAFRVPGSSLTNSFDPLAPSVSHPGPPTDDQNDTYNQQVPPPLPGYVVTPIARDVSDLISFPADSWIHSPTYDSEPTFESAGFANNQQPMFLIHKPVNMPSWPAYQAMEASHLYSDVQHVPIMTYTTQAYSQVNNPSVSDIDSSREHSRNPSSSHVQHVSQSIASSPSHQGSYALNHPDLLSADEFSSLHTDGNPSDFLLSETASLLQSNSSQFVVEDLSTKYDPFDEIVQRKIHSDDF